MTTSDHYNTLLGFFCPFLCPPAPIQGPLWWCWSSAHVHFPRHIRAAFPFLQVNVIHTANPMEHASHIAAQPQDSSIPSTAPSLTSLVTTWPTPTRLQVGLCCPAPTPAVSSAPAPPGSEQPLANPAFIPHHTRKLEHRQGSKGQSRCTQAFSQRSVCSLGADGASNREAQGTGPGPGSVITAVLSPLTQSVPQHCHRRHCGVRQLPGAP